MRQSGNVRDRVREVNWNLVVEQAMKFGAANVLGVCSTRRRKWGLPSAICRATRPSRLCPGGHCAPRGHRAKHTRSFASPYCLPALLHYGSSIKSSVGILFTGWRALCRSLSHATRYTMSCELGLPSVCATFQLQIPLHAEEGAVQLPATFGNNISLSVCSVEATATNQKTPLRPRGRCTVQVHVHSIRCQSILVRMYVVPPQIGDASCPASTKDLHLYLPSYGDMMQS